MKKQDKLRNHYKDKKPEETVKFIKGILKSIGVDTEEKWTNDSIIDVYSLRVNIEGTNGIGANGKGISKEYALASAYSELMERLQNFALRGLVDLKEVYKFRFFHDEKDILVEELLDSSNSFVDNIVSTVGAEQEKKEDKARLLRTLLSQYLVDDRYFTCVPAYSVHNQQEVYIPLEILSSFYGSNGMCAGNNESEALVQGISEIFERFSVREIITKKIIPPNIAEEVITNVPKVKEYYEKLKKEKEYEVIFKDCSLGCGLPVVALVIIHKNSGKYGINFGAHPDIRIAIERTFTEASQSGDILKYSQNSEVGFDYSRINTRNNLQNFFFISKGQFPIEFFSSSSVSNCNDFKDVSHMENDDILIHCINLVKKMGYDILIRNNTFLKFPTYQVVVPGMSEISNMSEKTFRMETTFNHVTKLLDSPSKISGEDIDYIIAIISYYSKCYCYIKLEAFKPANRGRVYPFSKYRLDIPYFIMNLCIMQEEYRKSLSIINTLLEYETLESDDKDFLIALKFYLNLKIERKGNEEIKRILHSFFDNIVVEKIESFYLRGIKLKELGYFDDSRKEDTNYKNLMIQIKAKVDKY